MLISPLSPESIIRTISRASSTGSTTGPKNELGVSTPANSFVLSCPGVTRMVLISLDPGGAVDDASSARNEACMAIRPALAAV